MRARVAATLCTAGCIVAAVASATPTRAGNSVGITTTSTPEANARYDPDVPAEKPATTVVASGEVSGTALTVMSQYSSVSWSRVPSGSPPAGPVCSFRPANYTYTPHVVDDPADTTDVIDGAERHRSERADYGGASAEPRQERYRNPATFEFVGEPGPGVLEYMHVTCPGHTPRYTWVPTAAAVSGQGLIDSAFDRASEHLPLPAQTINPAPEHGAPAQLGLWLAVDDPGQLNVVAQAGPVWAAITATYQATSWEMGNGDRVACNGLGTPYPWGADLVEQGPCGYTYRLPSDIGINTITVTATWNLHLATSTGRDEQLDTATVSTTIDYNVYEIVTVGGWEP